MNAFKEIECNDAHSHQLNKTRPTSNYTNNNSKRK